MFKNPEFIRNTWTELTAKKLAAMPLLLITVYLLAYILDEALPFSFLPYICVFFYCVFTYIWSTRLAAETVIREINANTWSFQVMTSMSPVKMAIGKLFGSTIYIWYGNFICFALYLLSYHLHRERLPEIPLPELLTNVLIFVLFGLSAQILPLLLSLHSIRWRHFFEKFDVTFFQFMGIAMIIPLYKVFNGSGEGIVWYGAHYTAKEAAVVFLSVFIVWGFIAIVNQIKTEFGQEPYPVSWFLFTLSLVAVLFGFNDYGSDNPLVRYVGTLSAFFAVLAVTYLTLCGESNMALRPNMVSKYYHGKQYKRLFMIMPRSLVTIPVIIVLALVLSAEFGSLGQEQGTSAGFMVWAMILFMLRDFCFIYLWSLFAQGNEKETTVVPVLIALFTYTIVPVLLYHFDLRIFCPFFMPYFHESSYLTYNESAFLTVIPPALEFVFMLVLLTLGIRKKFRELRV